MLNLRKMVFGLPSCNRNLLMVLMSFLHLVTEHQHVNKMSGQNLALVLLLALVES